MSGPATIRRSPRAPPLAARPNGRLRVQRLRWRPARRRPPPPDFGKVRVNDVKIPPEAIAREIQHHPALDPTTAWREPARVLAARELLLQEAARLGV